MNDTLTSQPPTSAPGPGSHPSDVTTLTNSQRIRWEKEYLLKAYRKRDWVRVELHAAEMAKLSDMLSRGEENVKTYPRNSK